MDKQRFSAEAPEASSSCTSVMQPGESNSGEQHKAAAAASPIIKWPSSRCYQKKKKKHSGCFEADQLISFRG